VDDVSDNVSSRAFRQVVCMEIFWIVPPGGDPFRDWEARFREAVMGEDPPGDPGVCRLGPVVELTPEPDPAP
jgi:hypothetical protein